MCGIGCEVGCFDFCIVVVVDFLGEVVMVVDYWVVG